MKSPTNTTQRHADCPEETFLGVASMGSSEFITGQESRGQRELVSSQALPTKIDAVSKAALEKAGVKFLGPVEGDDMFQYVELPAGWKKEATDHSMWSNLVDDKGRTRATIFYKAAFYDREAFLNASIRYQVVYDYSKSDKEGIGVASVMDGTSVIFSTDPIKVDQSKRWESSQAAREAATKWLDEHFPDWKDVSAYWD